MLDRDPLLANPEEIRATRVLQTWIGGVRVHGTDSATPDERERRISR